MEDNLINEKKQVSRGYMSNSKIKPTDFFCFYIWCKNNKNLNKLMFPPKNMSNNYIITKQILMYLYDTFHKIILLELIPGCKKITFKYTNMLQNSFINMNSL